MSNNPGAHPHDCACGCGNAAFTQALTRLVDEVHCLEGWRAVEEQAACDVDLLLAGERYEVDTAGRVRALRPLRRDADESEVWR